MASKSGSTTDGRIEEPQAPADEDRTPPPALDELDAEEENEQAVRDEVGKMLRRTVKELESALKESRQLLSERDKEISLLKSELEQYKQQVVKEVANKTRLAQTLDESTQHATDLEETLQHWQISMKENHQKVEQLQVALQQERMRCVELEQRFSELFSKKSKETEQLTSQLVETRQKLGKGVSGKLAAGMPQVDELQLNFLKQAVYYLLTDFHAEEQLRAILSILDFSAQERKAVYAKVQEKKSRSKGSSGLFL